ncbi:MAG: nitroreductase family protein [Candidatus Aminicenantales bacterium]
MAKKFSEDANAVLDEIIRLRRTIRAFAEECPPKEAVEQLIKVGSLAPYAALAVAGRAEFRRFFVFERGTPARNEAARLVQLRAQRVLEKMLPARSGAPAGGVRDEAYLGRLKMLAESGHPSLAAAPYYIVVAEYQGVPPAGLQSLAHVLENMWLKATALGLAFQLISVTESMAEDEAFVRLLGLPFGEYVMDGCAIGYPGADPPPAPRPDMRSAVKWL